MTFSSLLSATDDAALPMLFSPAAACGSPALRDLGLRLGRTDPATQAAFTLSGTRNCLYETAGSFLGLLVKERQIQSVCEFYRAIQDADTTGRWKNAGVVEEMTRRVRYNVVGLDAPVEQFRHLSQVVDLQPACLIDRLDAETVPPATRLMQWLVEDHPEIVQEELSKKAFKRQAMFMAALALGGSAPLEQALALHPAWISKKPDASTKQAHFLMEMLTRLADNKNSQPLLYKAGPVIAGCAQPEMRVDLSRVSTHDLQAVLEVGPSPLLEAVSHAFKEFQGAMPAFSFPQVSPSIITKMHHLGVPVESLRLEGGCNFMHAIIAARPNEGCESAVLALTAIAPHLAFAPNDAGLRPVDLLENLNLPKLGPVAQWMRRVHAHMQGQDLNASTSNAPARPKLSRI